MRFSAEAEAARFAVRVMPFLEREIEHNLPATILSGILRSGAVGAPAVLVGGTDDGGEIAMVALRTPPLPMICTALADLAGDPAGLLDIWLAIDPALPGLNAPVLTARALAAELERRTGRDVRARLATELHALTRVSEPPHPAPGTLRAATVADDELIIDWMRQFGAETGAIMPDPAPTVRERRDSSLLWLWCDPAGQPVCLVGAHPPVAGIPRVAPVYTPPERRRRGYAGSAVAAASRWLLGAGARACVLFTDQANPASNRLYRAIGYQPIGRWEEYALS